MAAGKARAAMAQHGSDLRLLADKDLALDILLNGPSVFAAESLTLAFHNPLACVRNLFSPRIIV